MKKQRLLDAFIILIFMLGLGLLLYPTVSNYINSRSQLDQISNYAQSVENIDQATFDEMFEAARAFNAVIAKKPMPVLLTDEQMKEYESLLDVTGTGMMGYIVIPKINLSLPIYHGTEDAVLQKNIGHLAGTSLPVGGESTHVVLSGHRGLPSAELFTHLDALDEGDIFHLKILNETLTYEVDSITTVLPEDSAAQVAISVVEGMDYCTLVTCTPYGINTHRLLVRGHRIETPEDGDTDILGIGEQSEVSLINSWIVTTVVGIPIVLVSAILLTVRYFRRKRQSSKSFNDIASKL